MRFIIMPETGSGKGTGHLVRSIDLAVYLPGAQIYIPPEIRPTLVPLYPALKKMSLVGPAELPEVGAELDTCIFIVDRPQVSETAIRYLLERGMVIGIDVIGAGLRRIPLVIDLLPRLRQDLGWRQANLAAPGYLNLPKTRRQVPEAAAIRTVLVAFGGEDPAGLRGKLLASGLIQGLLPAARVDILNGPRMAPLKMTLPGQWHAIDAITRLRERLHEWDLVITSFGLTAYEARAAGCRVILLNPAPYHERLSRRDGFSSCGVGRPQRKAFQAALAVAQAPIKHPTGKAAGPHGLAASLLALENPAACACPACGTRGNPVIRRSADRSFFRCSQCGIIHQQLFGAQTISYNEAYFFNEYEKQYGKTYLDDFEHIKLMGEQRLNRMQSHGHARPGERLLDIGCAYGPFLAAAKERGLEAQGCDISPEAVAWVIENLGIPARSGDIRLLHQRDFGAAFDVVSLWYVIEHFPDLHRVLAKLNSLLVPGGLLALATPSGEGISARTRPLDFFRASPRDHYSVWRPSQVTRLLEIYGFRLASISVTGHHPERFPGILGRRYCRGLSQGISRIFNLGDTFELYAIKIHDLEPSRRQPKVEA